MWRGNRTKLLKSESLGELVEAGEIQARNIKQIAKVEWETSKNVRRKSCHIKGEGPVRLSSW
jgi:hypothetical protein